MPPAEYLIVAHLIRDLRVEAGLKQTDLANRLSVAQSVVSKYETAERRLDVLEIRDICAICGVSLGEFVERLESRLRESADARR
jgi:transcriptional regulator with XRE-family HTH domain